MLSHALPSPTRPAGMRQMFTLLLVLAALAPLSWRTGAGPAPAPPARQSPGALPLIVVPTGRPEAPFGAYGVGGGVSFQPDAVALGLPGGRLLVRFVGALPGAALEPADRRQGVISSHIGDPSTWRESVPTYAALVYRGLYPGVDLRYDGVAGDLKGTYSVAAHADPSAIRWRYEGARGLAIDPASGDLVIALADGASLRERAPVAWQEVGGGRAPVAARFALVGDEARFALGAYDPALPLIIDPTLTVGTFLGGGSSDYGRDIAVDAKGNIYVVGDFFSSDFLGSDTRNAGSKDVIILKLTPAGDDLVYGLFEGSSGADEGLSIAVSAAGEAYVLVDPDGAFPLKSAPISSPPEVGDAILMKVNAAGGLVYSTYVGLGVSNTHTGQGLALGADGKLYVTGQTYVAIRRLGQIALSQVNPGTGAVVRSFDRGDHYADSVASSVAVGSDGRVYLTGQVFSRWPEDFPTTPNAYQPTCGRKLRLGDSKDCDGDAFAMIFSPDLQVQYASYLGGSGDEEGVGLAVDRQGNMIIAGTAFSSDFPLKNAIQPSCPIEQITGGCSYDSFVAKLAPATGLVYSTYITSTEPEAQTFATDVAVDGEGNAYVYGFTSGTKLPMKNAVQPALATGICLGGFDRFCFDAFITGLAPNGSLRFGSYLGGTFDEYSGGIAVDAKGALYMTGYTQSANFPTVSGAIQPSKGVNNDFFVAKIGLGGIAPNPGPRPDLGHEVFLPLIVR